MCGWNYLQDFINGKKYVDFGLIRIILGFFSIFKFSYDSAAFEVFDITFKIKKNFLALYFWQ